MIDKLRSIVLNIPNGKSMVSGNNISAIGYDTKLDKYVACDGVYKFHWVDGWSIHSYSWSSFVLNVISIEDIKKFIKKYDSENTGHQDVEYTHCNDCGYESTSCSDCCIGCGSLNTVKDSCTIEEWELER